MLATSCHWGEEQHLTFVAFDRERTGTFGDDDPYAGLRRGLPGGRDVERHHIWRDDLIARVAERLPGVQSVQQRWARVELLCERFERVVIHKRVQFRLLDEIVGDVSLERTSDIRVAEDVGDDRRLIASLFLQPLHGLVVNVAGGAKPAALLKRSDSLSKLETSGAIDFPWGEAGAVEHHLRRQCLRSGDF